MSPRRARRRTWLAALAAAGAVAIVEGCGGEDAAPSHEETSGAAVDGGAAGDVTQASEDARGDAPREDDGGLDAASAEDARGDAPSEDDGGQDADADVEPPPPPGPLAPDFVDYDVNHVLVTGQSNAVSNSGTPVLSTTQPYTNLAFDTGVMPMKGCNGAGCTAYDPPASFVPLVEGDRFFNYGVETAGAGLANEIAYLGFEQLELGVRPGYPQKHDVLVSNHGRSGNTYWCLRKGGCNYKPGYLEPFAQGLLEVQSGMTLAQAAGKTYVVRAVATVHGESDHYSYTSNTAEFPLDGTDGTPNAIKDYGDGLVEWQRDYEAEIKAITGQVQPVPLLVSQISGWNDTSYGRVAQMQLEAHVKAPGKVLLIGPAYHLALSQSDCMHYTNHGVRRLGEYFAKVYARVVLEGKTWEPVRPKHVARVGSVVTVQFHVPKPPLVVDTARVAEAASYGFTYVDASGAAAPGITGVAVVAPDAVEITLARAPVAANRRLRYAHNQVMQTCIGTPFGARGNLRDSDDTPSRSGYDLHNWAVHFDVAVP